VICDYNILLLILQDEYEKNTEFFDEFHEDGGVEKHGEHHHDHESEKGGHEKKGHHDGADHEEKFSTSCLL